MRELRIQSHGDPLRVFYAFDPNRSSLYDDHLNSLNTQPKP